MWLTTVRSFFPKPMLKANDQWSFTVIQQKLLGPRNPYQQTNSPQKAALVAVTRSGMIRVLYQGQDNRWQDFKSESENIAGPTELLTHATMCPEKIVEFKSTEKGKSTDKGECCLSSSVVVTDLHNKKVHCFLQLTIARMNFESTDSA